MVASGHFPKCARKRAHRSCTPTHEGAETRVFLQSTYSGRSDEEVERSELLTRALALCSQRGGREFEPPAVHHVFFLNLFASHTFCSALPCAQICPTWDESGRRLLPLVGFVGIAQGSIRDDGRDQLVPRYRLRRDNPGGVEFAIHRAGFDQRWCFVITADGVCSTGSPRAVCPKCEFCPTTSHGRLFRAWPTRVVDLDVSDLARPCRPP